MPTVRQQFLRINRAWIFPPPCLKERCLDFVVQWLGWMKVGRYGHGDEAPAEYYQFSGMLVLEDLNEEIKNRKY